MSPSDSNPSSQSDSSAIEVAASVVARARQRMEEGANGAARELVKALEGLGDALRNEDATSDAEAAYREAMVLLEKGEVDLPQRARLGSRLATLLDSTEREADSVPVYEQAITDYEAMTPPDEDVAAQLRNNLAMTYKGLGKHSLAEQHYLRALEILEQKHGLESEFTATLFNNLGSLYYTAGYSEQGKEMLVEALEIRTRLLGPDHPDVAQSFCNLASTCHELGEGLAAQEHYERGLSILEKHIKDEAASYEAVGLDYIALLEDQKETTKAAAFQKRMAKVLSSV